MEQIREWHDTMDPARAAAMHAVLHRSGPAPAQGDALPPFWHYIHFLEVQPSALLGRDGHPKTGGFIPDLGLPRRMWAGGSLTFHAPLIIGTKASKRSRITDVSEKPGKTGPLAIVSISHEIHQNDRLCISETQRLIYRGETDQKAPTPPTAPTNEVIRRSRHFSTVDLFRYSALTVNGHRIHYDRDYARDVEGYPDLVVHGPLLAQKLIELGESMLDGLKTFEFRAISPAFDTEEITFCALPVANGIDLWARASDGRLCMSAFAT